MEPIDYNSPLGISKREWTKVLGANLALLLVVYTIALVCTVSGSDVFLLKFYSDDLQRIEETLRNWGVYAFIQAGFATVEMTIVSMYVAKAKIKWWFPLAYYFSLVGLTALFFYAFGLTFSWLTLALDIMFYGFAVFALNGWKPKERWFVYLFRLLIALVLTFTINEGIAIFRTKVYEIWHVQFTNSALFALSVEYDLAIALAFGFLTMVIPWKKGGKEQCPTSPAACGSSPITTNSSRKNSKTAKTSLSPKHKRRLLWLRIRVFVIQTVSLIVIAALPWFTGKPIEFALVYVSFCMTRLMLGFNRSLHFKSELACVTIGALTFWGLTFLSPSAEASIILSLAYGCATALGFRLYWELHDLMMYRKAAKTDRYAMLYAAFKGNVDPKHINGVMRAKGYDDKDHDIRMVQMYMQREKVEYIAEWTNYAKITVEKRLTEIANDLYKRR